MGMGVDRMNKINEAAIKKHKKKRNRLIFRSIILAILFGALVFAIVTNLKNDDKAVGVGEKAPDFELPSIRNVDGEVLRLSDLKGKGIMLNFWATYCEPCEEEMPYMESLYPEYKEKGIEILAVSVDATELVIHNFSDRYDLSFPILHDRRMTVLDHYGVRPLPTTYFIDENGIVVERVIGGLTLERLEGYLKQIEPS